MRATRDREKFLTPSHGLGNFSHPRVPCVGRVICRIRGYQLATTKPRKATATPTPAPTPPAPNPAPAAAGLPRWVLILGALVPVGGLVWGVVTHFVPRVETAKPPAPAPVAAAAPAPAPVPSVSVSGSGNVGVGVMTGGTINNGKP